LLQRQALPTCSPRHPAYGGNQAGGAVQVSSRGVGGLSLSWLAGGLTAIRQPLEEV